MKYYIIAGEASGDLHGANLIKALHQTDNQATIRVWGGDMMQQAGATLVKHYRHHAFMGIGQVLSHLPTIWRNFRDCKADIVAFEPDALILIDYSGFNLRIAKWVKQQQLTCKIYYYISPQVWATRAKRVQTIKACVDEMFVILPFEEAFYQKHNYPVHYVGHPLLDVVEGHQANPQFRSQNDLDERPIVALLPGSRRQEITAMLPIMLGVAAQFPQYQFVVAGAPSQTRDFYAPFMQHYPNVKLVEYQTYDLLSHSLAAFVTSGTATLETALFNIPQVVCYKTSALFYWVVRNIIQIKYISLVNLILDKEAVRELIQHELTTETLAQLLQQLGDAQHPYRQTMLADYAQLRTMLGTRGAAMRAARIMYDALQTEDGTATVIS